MLKTYITDCSLVIVAVIWALNFSVIKIALEEIDPFSFNELRYSLASFTHVFVAKWKRKKILVKKEHLLPLILTGIVGNVVYQSLFIIGIDLTFVANSAVILGTIPVWIALLAHIFTEEKLTFKKSIGLITAFLGVGLIISGREGGFNLGLGKYSM